MVSLEASRMSVMSSRWTRWELNLPQSSQSKPDIHKCTTPQISILPSFILAASDSPSSTKSSFSPLRIHQAQFLGHATTDSSPSSKPDLLDPSSLWYYPVAHTHTHWVCSTQPHFPTPPVLLSGKPVLGYVSIHSQEPVLVRLKNPASRSHFLCSQLCAWQSSVRLLGELLCCLRRVVRPLPGVVSEPRLRR